MARKRQSGHYCWACDRRRANEKFSGKGHAQHLCKECARLGKDELAFRQAIRNLERLLTWDGRIARRNLEQFRKYLHHKDERVRAYAQQIEAADALARAEQQHHRDVAELPDEPTEEYIFPLNMDSSPNPSPDDDTEIPF
jgi:hypothetical protein